MATGLDVNTQASGWIPQSVLSSRYVNKWRFALLALLCLSLPSCGIYTADEITATVVDADTKTPLAGVNVVAAWIVRGGINFGATVGYLKVMETVTDQNGKFHFSRWGPRPNFYLGEIRQEAPVLMLFKSGYRYTPTQNQGSALTAAPNAMKSDWNDQIILMKRYSGMKPDYDAGFIPLLTDMEDLKRHGYWADIPGFLCALGREHKVLSNLEVPNLLYSFDALNGASIDCHDTRGGR
jgi:hypothetical protein